MNLTTRLLPLFMIALLSACHGVGKKNSKHPVIETIRLNDSTIRMTEIVEHNFSDYIKEDTFKLQLTGKSIADGWVILTITTFENKKIYADTFHAVNLDPEYEKQGFTKKQYEDNEKHNFHRFLFEYNFYKASESDPQADSTILIFFMNIGPLIKKFAGRKRTK